jgi:nucleotide-binding universal stress UspA family protein
MMEVARMQEPRAILAPVDFSTHSRAAAMRACSIAVSLGAKVRLIHALDLPEMAKKDGIAPHLWDELRQSERRKLDQLQHDLGVRGVPLSAIIEERDPVEMITEYAACTDVELIVMGSHGYRGFDRMFLGSVAERSIRAVTVPVMTVKENEWDAGLKIRRILLATDFSPDSERAVRLAIKWAQILGADVEVFHAIHEAEVGFVSDGVPGSTDHLGRLRQEALEGLQSILSRMSDAGVPASADLTYGPASLEIEKRAAESRANLVIMGRRGQTRLERAFFGSVATRVLRQVKCSVLLPPGKDVDAHSDRRQKARPS